MILLLLMANLYQSQNCLTPEQIAIDYFFERIFPQDFKEYNVVESNQRTKIDESYGYGFVYQCDNYGIQLIDKILNSKATSSTFINSNKCPVKTRKIRKNSSRLKIEVYSRVQIENQFFVYINVYKKLHFVEHYILTVDQTRGRLIDSCHFSEII